MTYQPPQQPYRVPPSTYVPGAGTEAMLTLKDRLEGVWLTFVAVRAAKNSHAMSADWETAIIHGAHAARRWWVWLLCSQAWLLSTLFCFWLYSLKNVNTDPMFQSDPMLDGYLRNGMIFIPLSFVFSVLVPYVRNVDFSLFKRRFVYKVTAPLASMVERVPNFWLYLLAFWIPLVGWIQWG